MFIKSNHQYEVEIAGVLLPKRKYSYAETTYGKRTFVEVTEDELNILKKDGVFKSLIETKQYEIVERLPKELLSPVDRLKQVQTEKEDEKKELKAQIAKLKKENEKLLKKLTDTEKAK